MNPTDAICSFWFRYLTKVNLTRRFDYEGGQQKHYLVWILIMSTNGIHALSPRFNFSTCQYTRLSI